MGFGNRSRGGVCVGMQRTNSGMEMRVVLNGGKSKWLAVDRWLRQRSMSPILLNWKGIGAGH